MSTRRWPPRPDIPLTTVDQGDSALIFGFEPQADRFCPECGARLYTRNLETLPGLVFVTIGGLDNPGSFAPLMEMFVKRRLDWAKPLGVAELTDMPT